MGANNMKRLSVALLLILWTGVSCAQVWPYFPPTGLAYSISSSVATLAGIDSVSTTGVGTTLLLKGGAGGATSGNAGGVQIQAGTAANGIPGALTMLAAAASGTTTHNGGGVTLGTGNGIVAGNGGPLSVSSGNAGTTGTGGQITIRSGLGGTTSGNSGSILIETGTVTSGTPGNVQLLVKESLGLTINSDGSVTISSSMGLGVVTVATLPTCNTALKGRLYAVSDATAPLYNTALTGGGTVSVPVYCNGTAWTAH